MELNSHMGAGLRLSYIFPPASEYSLKFRAKPKSIVILQANGAVCDQAIIEWVVHARLLMYRRSAAQPAHSYAGLQSRTLRCP
jgi:hypothetical protein